ncbi:MAG: ATP-binding protein [Phycisphaerales bacterium]
MAEATPTTQPAGASQNGAPTADEYTSSTIQVLEGLEAIRKRPGMYVGGSGPEGLHHLVYECVDNAIDEVMAGYATEVFVTIGVDGSCTVKDDGRGMPVDPMKHENPAINGRPAVEVILTEVHAGGKFDGNAYKVSGGLHGVGIKCVNALSEWTEVEVDKGAKTWNVVSAKISWSGLKLMRVPVRPPDWRSATTCSGSVTSPREKAIFQVFAPLSTSTTRSSPTPRSSSSASSTACAS